MRPYYVTSALHGTNVVKTLKQIIKMACTDLEDSINLVNQNGKC